MPTLRSALIAAAAVPVVAAAVAVAGSPSLTAAAATTSATVTPTATSTTHTVPATTTGTSTSTTKPTSSSTSCYRGPSTLTYTPGATIAAYHFDTSTVPSAFTPISGTSLTVVPDTTSGGVLQVTGLDSTHPVELYVDTRGWGPFELKARVRTDNGLPSELNVTVGDYRKIATVALDPRTYLQVSTTFDAATMLADWYCNGTMTGGRFPTGTRLQFKVMTTCEGLDPIRTLLLDDIVITKSTSTSTYSANPAANPAATTITPTTLTSTSTSTTKPATSTTSPTLTCPAVTSPSTTTTSPKPSKSTKPKTTKSKSTKTKPTKPTTTKQAGLKCKVTLSAVNSWPSGWSAALAIANYSPTDVGPWTLTATLPKGETLAYGWPATFTQSGSTLTGTPPSFQSTLKAKSKVDWGLVLGGGTAAPTGWAINGTACAVS